MTRILFPKWPTEAHLAELIRASELAGIWKQKPDGERANSVRCSLKKNSTVPHVCFHPHLTSAQGRTMVREGDLRSHSLEEDIKRVFVWEEGERFN